MKKPKKKPEPKPDRNFEIGQLMIDRFWLQAQLQIVRNLEYVWQDRIDTVQARIDRLRKEQGL